MNFFIPHAQDQAEQESVYHSIREHVSVGNAELFSDRRVFELKYVHDGNSHQAKVGEDATLNGEVVIAILYDETRRLYHVCTPNRGVVRGNSIMVGANSVRYVEDFD